MQNARGLHECKHAPRMKLLSGSSRRLILLAPSGSDVPSVFNHVHTDPNRYKDFLGRMQTLRGNVYLQIGAIEPRQLTAGRHLLPVDNESWHLLAVDAQNGVCGCIRYRQYPNQTPFSQLGVAKSALARCRQWGPKLEAAVEAELELSRSLRLPYVEVGGWALLQQLRGTPEALRMALAMYGLSQALGGALGITTANRGNCSASVLRRIGGLSLEHQDAELPPFHDPQYKREIEVLRFHSWAPNPRYKAWIDGIKAQLSVIPVLTNAIAGLPWGLDAARSAPIPVRNWSGLQFQAAAAVH